jgi:hypothetical protein
MASPLVLQPDAAAGKDAQIIKAVPTYNYGVGTSIPFGLASARRALLQFDLLPIPASATVTSAVLSLYCFYVSGAATTLRLFRVRRAWDEGTQSGAAGNCCWNNAQTGVAWGTAGCDNTDSDREADELGSASVGTGTGVWVDIPLDAAKVQGWVSGSFANNGMVGWQDDATYHSYYSSDWPTAAQRPKLTVAYTEGSSAVLPVYYLLANQ